MREPVLEAARRPEDWALLSMGTLAAVQDNLVFPACYQRLRRAGKLK